MIYSSCSLTPGVETEDEPPVFLGGTAHLPRSACSPVSLRSTGGFFMDTEGFLSRIDKTDSCWLWTGSLTYKGYGQLAFGDRKNIPAHRVAYSLFRGTVTSGLCVLHTCDVRNCVTHDPLYIGTPKDNMRDDMQRHRNPSGEIHGSAKLTWLDVDQIRKSKESSRNLAMKYRVSYFTINAVKRGEEWHDDRR